MFTKLKGKLNKAKRDVTASRPLRKGVAILCLVAMMFQLGLLLPLMNLIAAGSPSASKTTEVATDSAIVTLNSELTDIGNGNFTLRFKGSSRLKDAFAPTVRTASEDGTFTVSKDGFYLIELWGGNGGNGGNSAQSEGGIGGAGGYIYGYIYLHEGDQLVYTVGTNGATIASVGSGLSSGGGENEGGDKDGNSAYSTGTGGGFSAIYLFEKSKGEVYSGDLTRAERLNHYIMIAGGGGGGGAGNQLLIPANGRPNGGNGGSLTSISGHLAAGDNNGVAGTFFNGRNGSTSGTNTSYIGRGGSNLPGATTSTLLDWASSNQPADDWINSNGRPEGSGGDGILRGGAGGAGFCGGSGGIQSSVLLASNIGGGGGGSSFISDEVNYTSIPASYSAYLTGTNPSTVGGACYITMMIPDGLDTVDMTNVSASVRLSKYFEVVSAYVDNGNGVATTTVNPDGTTTVDVAGANISYNIYGIRDKELSLVLSLRPKAGFAGGNNVPLYPDDERFTITALNSHSVAEYYRVAKSDPVDYANVALQFAAIGNSFTTSDETRNFAASDLYTDNYVGIRDALSDPLIPTPWEYECINAIGEYTVTGEAPIVGGVIHGTDLTPPGLYAAIPTQFQVAFLVEPKTDRGFAEVGAPIYNTLFTASATITLLGLDEITIGEGLFGEDFTIRGGKSLQYASGKYRFAIDSSLSLQYTVPQPSGLFGSNHEYTVEADGWYYIEALGGAGGGAGSAVINVKNDNSTVTANGAGQSVGGYTGGYIHLNKGDRIAFTTGGVGSSSGDDSADLAKPSGFLGGFGTSEASIFTQGGARGGNSVVTLNGSLIMVAGGGGGAGGAAVGARQTVFFWGTGDPNTSIAQANIGASGSVNTSALVNTSAEPSGEAVGTAGTASSSPSATAGTAGTAGINIIKGSFFAADAPDVVKTTYTNYQQIEIGAKAGEGAISCIVTDAELNTEEKFTEYFSIEGKFSRYFTIADASGVPDIKMVSADIGSAASTLTGPDASGFYTRTYNDGTNDVASFMYKLVTDTSGTSFVIKNVFCNVEPVAGDVPNQKRCASRFGFEINLVPAEGFFGGNNVPLVDASGITMRFDSDELSRTLVLSDNDRTDLANVEINYTFDESKFEVLPEKNIECGDTVDLNDPTILIQDGIVLKSAMPASEQWKADFVEIVPAALPSPDNMVSPNRTTVYSYRQTVKPYYDGTAGREILAEVVAPISAEGVYIERHFVVFVSYDVTTVLQHITAVGPDRVMDGSDITMMLIADRGYDLPASFNDGVNSITVGGTPLGAGQFTYDSVTGELFIPDDSIIGDVVITANAEVRMYTIHWIDQTSLDTEVYTQHFAADEVIVYNETWYDSFLASKTPPTGKVYTWDYTTPDGKRPVTMPAGDLYFYGSFTAVPCRLEITYYEYGTTNTLAPTYSKLYAYGSDYNVLSPEISGYLADQLTVAGTITADTYVTVYYSSTAGQLNIIYIRSDNDTIVTTYSASVADGMPYSVSYLDVLSGAAYDEVRTHFLPRSEKSLTGDETVGVDRATVSGTMTSEGAVYYVYLNPRRYTTTFVTYGGTVASTTRSNVYNNLLGFDPIEGGFVGMPEPQLLGYDFVGWSTVEHDCPKDGADGDCDCASSAFVTEETVVKGDVTLYAHYKVHRYTFRMKFMYMDGFQYRNNGNAVKTVREDYVVQLKKGETVNLYMPDGTSLFIEGYTPTNQQTSSEIVNGAPASTFEMGYANTVIYVEYFIQKHNVTLELYGADGRGAVYTDISALAAGLQLPAQVVEYNQEYSFTLPDYESIGYRFDGLKADSSNFSYTGASATLIDPNPAVTTSGGNQSVHGLGGLSDLVIRVYYDYIYYTLTIDYNCGSQTGDHTDHGIDYTGMGQYTADYHVGQAYSIPSPVVPNHSCDKPLISGTYGVGDLHEVVTYTLGTHTLTIHYVYSDTIANAALRGTTAFPDVVRTLEHGQSYSEASPEIMGYFVSYLSVSGNLLTDREVTVYYTDAPTLSVTVTFGALEYDFRSYVWDPMTHLFKTQNPGTEIYATAVGGNVISVTKEGGDTMDVVASIGFTRSASAAYTAVQACFTAGASDALTTDTEVNNIPLDLGVTANYYLRLYGGIDLSQVLDGESHLPLTGTVGTVTVTISEKP